jgi:GT2 family glycosyltransferase
MTTSLSIVIPSHRRTDLLRLCLASVERHAPIGTEIIVVDDGSPDAMISLTAFDFPNVRTIRHSRSRGFCAAANAGIQAARSEIVQLLNDDTQVTRSWADSALKCFDDASVGAVAPLVLQGTPESRQQIIDSAGDRYDPGGFACKRGRGEMLSAKYQQACFVDAASGSSVFLRRAALLKTGLFPESFGAYFEDVDLSLRLTAVGYCIRFEPASIVWHQVGGSYGRSSRKLVERQSCNEERLFWRNRCRGLKPLLRHLAVLGGKTVRRLREGRLIPFVMGRLQALREVISNGVGNV